MRDNGQPWGQVNRIEPLLAYLARSLRSSNGAVPSPPVG